VRYETYEQIEALDVDALRDVSVRGDSRERVWASWALGLRCGADEADRALEHEPNPGARRHLTIIVAGHGRSATVQRLAEHDADDRVRATAWQNLLSTRAECRPSDLIYARLSAGLSGAETEAILRWHDEQWPEDHVGLLRRLTDHDVSGVRCAAIDRLAERDVKSPLLSAVLDRRLVLETDRRIRRRLVAIGRAAGRIIVEAPPPRRAVSPYLPMVI